MPVARRITFRGGSTHIARVGLVILYLVCVAQSYAPGVGFTSLIMLSEADHAKEVPAVRETPHAHLGGYDGQFYAQIAVDPLLRDRATDIPLDNAPYRARRILCSWVAFAAGFGRPFWILQAYALENVVAWLLLAWWLHRRFPGADARSMAVWVGCLFCHGLMVSTTRALLDGPSLLLVVLAVSALERGRDVRGAVLLGVCGLARETNLLGLIALPAPWPPSPKKVLRAAGLVVLAVLPLALWLDYLRTIYLGDVLKGSSDLLMGFGKAYLRAWRISGSSLLRDGVSGTFAPFAILALVAVTVQAAWLAWDRGWRDPWWRLGAVYALMMVTLGYSVWEGSPGAFTRVLLPMQIVFNLRLAGTRWFWPLFVLGNLTVIPGLDALGVATLLH